MNNAELIAVVEKLYEDSDARVFAILSRIVDVIMDADVVIKDTSNNVLDMIL